MKLMKHVSRLITMLAMLAIPALAKAQSSSTWVDVGNGRAGAGGSATGQYQHVDTDSRVGPFGSVARGVAVGAGPNGLSISHSIGLNAGGQGTAHNFNLSIGPNGTHISRGNVNSSGGNSRVIAGGGSNVGSPYYGPAGGSYATGFGNHTVANTHAQSHRNHFQTPHIPSGPFGRPMGGPFGGPMSGPFGGPMGGPFGPRM